MSRRPPAQLVACVVVAFLHAAAWAVITPTFQPPDEPVHVGYAQYVAERGELPPPTAGFLPPEDLDAVFAGVPWSTVSRPSWDSAASRALQRRLDGDLSSTNQTGGAGYIYNNPPLYYALQAGPYLANEAAGGDLLDAVLLMRLLSAMLAASAVGFVWLFLRELFPSTPWAWTAGAMAVALQPLVGFIGGGVNNDNLVNAGGAAFLYLAVRTLRRPPDVKRAAILGIPVAVALLAKVSAYALAAALVLALIALVARAAGARGRAARAAAASLAVALVPFAAYIVLGERSTAAATGGLASTESFYTVRAIREQLSYMWQFWLPKLPFMQEQFPGYPPYPLWDTIFQGFVGRFGWFQYGFAPEAYRWALGVYVAVLAFAAAGLWRGRAALRRRWPESLVLAGAFAALVTMINVAGFRYRILNNHAVTFEQARYLLPLVGLYGAVVAAAVRGAGPRWGPALGVFLAVLAGGHAVAALLITLDRYYFA